MHPQDKAHIRQGFKFLGHKTHLPILQPFFPPPNGFSLFANVQKEEFLVCDKANKKLKSRRACGVFQHL